MTSNYYTILAVVRAINSGCAGWIVHTPFTQRRNELVIPVGPRDSGPTLSIVASCEPSANFLVTKQVFSRAARNSKDIFPDTCGQILRTVVMHPSDRLVAFVLEDASSIVIRFFGSRSNALHVDPAGKVLGTFLRARHEPEAILLPFPHGEEVSMHTLLQERLSSGPDRSVEHLLRSVLPMLGPVLVREVLFRSSIDGSRRRSDLPDNALRTLDRMLSSLREELHHPSPRIISQDDEPVSFSLVPLHHLERTTEELQSSISKGILRFLSLSRTRNTFLARKTEVGRTLSDEHERTHRSLKAVRLMIMSDAEIGVLERNGKIIHQHLSTLAKGMEVLEAVDPYTDEERLVSIPLDPMLSPAKNAERYFEKAKKVRARRDESVQRERDLSRLLDRFQSAEADLEATSDQEGLERFLHSYRDVLSVSSGKKHDGPGERALPPFRTYVVDGGFEVWVGKSSTNNDLLTTRHTSKNDLWFHARGVGGSHVVLKAGTRKGEISKRARYEAAAIAAHFSKMKKAKHVAVSMCLGKFVRKPRKAPPGTVMIEREEVLFVDPALPAIDERS